MSCADFDDIKTICLEFCKETEDRGAETPSNELMILPFAPEPLF